MVERLTGPELNDRCSIVSSSGLPVTKAITSKHMIVAFLSEFVGLRRSELSEFGD